MHFGGFAKLSVALVRRDRDGVRQVDAAGVLARHGDSEQRIRVAFVEAGREPGRFVAEHKRVAVLEAAPVERPPAMRRQELEPPWARRGEVVVPGVVQRHVEMRPVVKAGAGYRTVVQREPKRPDKVERHAQPDAQAPYRARVVRYLGTEKYYREVHLASFQQSQAESVLESKIVRTTG